MNKKLPLDYYLKHIFGLIIHVFMLLLFGKTALYIDELDLTDAPLTTIKTHRYVYFTWWNFIAQIIFMFVAMFDVFALILNAPTIVQKFLQCLRTILYNGIVLPFGLVLSSFFWLLYFINRDTVYPASYEYIFPSWVNNTFHIYMVIPIYLELWLPKREFFIKGNFAITVLLPVLFSYFYVSLKANVKTGVWMYTFFYNQAVWMIKFKAILLVFIFTSIVAKIGAYIQMFKKPKLSRSQKKRLQKQKQLGNTNLKNLLSLAFE